MDLYEALKTGTTVSQLTAAFKKDLIEAITKLKEQKKQEQKKEEKLTYCREQLANAAINYVEAQTGKNIDESVEDQIIDFLIEIEQEQTAITSNIIDLLFK